MADDLNTSKIALVGFLSAIVVFAIIVALQVLFYRVEAQEQYAKDISRPPAELSKLLADQRDELSGYHWVDEHKKVVAIPIDEAKRLVVDEYAHGGGPSKAASAPVAPKTDAAGAGPADDGKEKGNES